MGKWKTGSSQLESAGGEIFQIRMAQGVYDIHCFQIVRDTVHAHREKQEGGRKIKKKPGAMTSKDACVVAVEPEICIGDFSGP